MWKRLTLKIKKKSHPKKQQFVANTHTQKITQLLIHKINVIVYNVLKDKIETKPFII